MTRRPRIAYLATTSWTGGAERQVHDLAVRMAAAGWDVTAVSMLPLGGSFADLPAHGIPTASLDMRRGVADPRALVRLGMILRDTRPDVLHAHMVHANLLARLSRLIRRTPVVISTMHNQYQGARWRMVAYRATDRLGDATTAVSDVARRDAIRLGAVSADRIVTVPNGIELDRFARHEDARARLRGELGLGDGFVWLAVGRLAEAKDYPNLIRAFASLRGSREVGQLLIVGAGPDEAVVRARIDEAGLGREVRLLGERGDVPDLMSAADAYVMSSAWEGLPLVLLEAGASSLPIVTTDVGGNREAVDDGVSGFVVPPRDAAALAMGMARLLDLGRHERLAMGAAARALMARTFDMGVVSTRWQAMYRELLEARLPHEPVG
jgi:glycosyltransferase involved in cell wall biosynthesis